MSLSLTEVVRPPRGVGAWGANSRVAPVYLIPLIAATEQAGIAPAALFQGLGLLATDLEVPGLTVFPMEANTVVRRALRLLDAPDLGLAMGIETRITERGAMALGLLAAATLGDAIALTLEFPGSAGYLMAVHAELGSRTQLVVAEPQFGNDDIAPFLVDIMFAGSVRMRRQVSEAHYAPAKVELTRVRPANFAAYERHFACPVHFGCRRNVLTSALNWLDHPLPMANAMAYRLSHQLLTQQLEQADIPSALGLAVERAITRAFPLTATPADLAASLNMAERSLRRKLAQEGLSYRSLLDEARKGHALALMAGPRRTISDIALQTGFSDVRAFSRAFTRWTGKVPSAVLASAQSGKAGPDPGDGDR